MKGWGHVSFLVSAGIFTAAGCGGRTSMLEGDTYDPDDGGSSFGNTGTAGTKPNAGRNPLGGTSSGGAVTVGGRPNPGGGVSYGGSPAAGNYPGGAFPTAGFPSFAGAFPTGGVGGGVPNDCQTCIFSSCNVELSQCFQDFGCLSIFACAAASGCQGFDCYSDDACAGVIDQWGGLASPSMSKLLSSFSCVLTSGCPCN